MDTISTVIDRDGLSYIYKEISHQLEKDRQFISPENQENFRENIESELSETLKLIESTEQDIRSLAGLPQNDRTNQDDRKVDKLTSVAKNLKNLKDISQELPQINQRELGLKFGIYFLNITDSSIKNLNTKIRDSNPEILMNNDDWLKLAKENEKFLRRMSLKSPLDQADFEATLRWMIAKGEEEEDFVVLQQARFNPPYFSENIRKLFEISVNKVSQKLRQKGIEVRLCKIFCTQSELQRLSPKVNIIKNYSGWSTIVSNTTVILELQEYYPLEFLSFESPIDRGADKVRDYVVCLIAPINDSFKEHLRKLKAEFLQSLGGQEIVVAVPGGDNDILTKLKNLGQVDSVKPFKADIRVQTQSLENLGREVTEEMVVAARLEAAKHPPQRKQRSIPLPGILIASFFTSEDCQQAQETLRQQGIRIAEKAGSNAIVLDLNTHPNPLQAFDLIQHQVGLRSLEEDLMNTLFNDVARSVIARGVIPSNPVPDEHCLGLTGKGETIAICDSGLDTGDIGTLHLDFQGRVRQLQSYPIQPRYDRYVTNPGDNNGASDNHSGHGTHVVGSAIGNGQQAEQWNLSSIRGIASKAELIFQAIEQNPRWNITYTFDYLNQAKKLPPNYDLCGIPADLNSLFEAAYDNSKGAKIYSISWGKNNEFYPGIYDPFCESLDNFVWKTKEFLAVVAAGNFNGCVSSPGIAKNCITVGASESVRSQLSFDTYGYRWPDHFPPDSIFHTNGLVDSIDDIAPFSNRGPCATGRRKPDLVAPGTYILSTRSSQLPHNHFAESPYPEAEAHYMYMHGTSTATPLVAGCAALVRQYLREHRITMRNPSALLIQGNPESPSAAMVKAILIHSSQYIPCEATHPSSRADNEQGWGRINLCQALNPQTPTKVLFIDESQGLQTGDFREYFISLKDNSVPLRVTLVYTDPPGDNLINNLNLVIFSPSRHYHCGNDFEGNRVPDTLNNVEGCFILTPEIGQWRVRVIASNIAQDVQDYALVISGGEVEEDEVQQQ